MWGVEWVGVKFVSYCLLMAATVLANAVVVGLLYRQKQQFTGGWGLNLFVLNLALADLLVGLTAMPQPILNGPTHGAWLFGSFLCKVTAFIQVVAPSLSGFLLIGIAIDRYSNIVMSHRRSQLKMTVNILLAWLASFILSMPQLYGFGTLEVAPGIELCAPKPQWMGSYVFKVYMCTVFICVLIVPMVSSGLCYHRTIYHLNSIKGDSAGEAERRMRVCPILLTPGYTDLELGRKRTTAFGLTYLLAYFVCWFPYFLLVFLLLFTPVRVPQAAFEATEFLALAKSLVSPTLFAIYYRNRDSFLWLFESVMSKLNPDTTSWITHHLPTESSSLLGKTPDLPR